MYKYKITFVALKDTLSFVVKSPHKEIIESFVRDLLIIFASIDDNENLTINALQESSPELQQQIKDFVNKYNNNLPQLNQIPAFFKKLKEKEQFFFIPKIDLKREETFNLYNQLRASEEGISFEELNNQMTELFGDLLNTYHIKSFGDKRTLIGEPIKENRMCRFCNNQRENITFENKAHAISEGLGNKTVVLYDECDNCNTEFSQTIEPDIIQYLSLFRTIFDIKAKKGSKKFKGKNFDLRKEGSLKLSLFSEKDGDEKILFPYKVNLESYENDLICLQNIYKSLAKYFISVIDKEYLPKFKKTIEWINGGREADNLPKIAEMLSYHSFSPHPKLVCYIRKNDEKTIPFAVCEFYFTCKIFVFIIPFCEEDDISFIDESQYNKFWKTFKHYDKSEGWNFWDFSDNNKRKFSINLNFIHGQDSLKK